MNPRAKDTPSPRHAALLSIQIRTEQDVVVARRQTRELAQALGFASQDQVGLATAVSEIARNSYQYAKGGQVDCEIDLESRPQFLWVQVHDHGPGIRDLEAVLDGRHVSSTGMGIGVAGTRRLSDRFEISSSREGTSVRFGKARPAHLRPLLASELKALSLKSGKEPESVVYEELQQQERELLRSLEWVRTREIELEARRAEMERLNLELQETNRGVVALYAELEEKADALRHADALKSQFLSHVSHEFRTPVNAVMALTHLLLRHTDGTLTEEQEKQVSFIRKAAEGLTEMVDDLLDLAKVESGKTEIRLAHVELSQIFGAVRALMRPLATNEAVSLTFLEPPADLVMETDEGKLGQILRNLVSNALKFTDNGDVRVSASLDENLKLVSITVEDTGIGIAPEHLDTVFEEFSQVHSPISRKVKGTGLGLPLSRKLAGLLGGTLTVSSELNVGSRFILTLPQHIGGEDSKGSETPSQERNRTILIVDDEEASRYVSRHMFRGPNFRTIEADALDAAELARFERPDLIILDLMMPGRTGFEVLDELKSDTSTQSIPVVIHTSKTITDADLQRLKGGYIAILPKSGKNRIEALLAIRQALSDEELFNSEPEFGEEGK